MTNEKYRPDMPLSELWQTYCAENPRVPKKTLHDETFLSELGISHIQSHRWQTEASEAGAS